MEAEIPLSRLAAVSDNPGMVLGMEKQKSMKGVFLTLDVSVAMLMLFLALVVSYSYYGSNIDSGFGSQLLRAYAQDAATAMAVRGDFTQPLAPAGNANTSGIREVLRALPPSVCMEVSAYGTTVPDGLAGYWKLDEDSGTSAADSSGNGLSGTIYGSPSFLENGEAGRSYEFDGVSGYVDLGSPASFQNGTGQRTICGWGRADSASGGEAWIASYGNAAIGQAMSIGRDGSKLVGGAYGDELAYSGFWNAGAWNHICLTYDGTTARLYANGQEVSTSPQAKSWNLVRNAAYIGRQVNGNEYWNGSIDDVRIYDRALSASEVRQLYSNPFNLLYVVNEPWCAHGSGETQSLTVPFSFNADQGQNDYYYAVIHAWYKNG